MALNISSEPLSVESKYSLTKPPPVPLSDCFRWCLEADSVDAILVYGSKANILVVFSSSLTAAPDGTAFEIWGYTFEFYSTEPFTVNSFRIANVNDTFGGQIPVNLATARNFENMIRANLFFNRATKTTIVVNGTDVELTIEWSECGEQARFGSEYMDFAGLTTGTGISGTPTNGVSPTYVDGFKIVTRPGYWIGRDEVFYPIAPFSGVDPDKMCSSVGPVCVDFVREFSQILYTKLPALLPTSFNTPEENGRSLMRLLSIEYGFVYREDCQPISGTIKKSWMVLGINAAFEVDDPYQMARYWPNHPTPFFPGGQKVEFLTTQPKDAPICSDGFAWLWLLNNWFESQTNYKLIASFSVFKNGIDGLFAGFNVDIFHPDTDGVNWFEAVNFNVSPSFVLSQVPALTAETLNYYEIGVVGVHKTTGAFKFIATDFMRFTVKNCCDGGTDIYFLTPAGGIGTMMAQINEMEASQDGSEINLDAPCESLLTEPSISNRQAKARYGGRTSANLRNYTRVSFLISAPNTQEWVRWIKHFRQSPQRWIRVKEEIGGQPLAKKFLIENGSGKIYTTGEGIQFEGVGYFGDAMKQAGTEPIPTI